MADELDPVVQQFEADVAEYIANVEEASVSAEEFAVAAEDAKVSADGLRDSLLEAAAAAGIYQDAAGKWRDASGRFASSAEMDALGLGRLRDDAIEAAASVKELGTQAEETAAKLDLMGLSGVSSFTSLVPLVGLIGGLVIAGAAVAPAFAAMGLSVGAFGLFAIPVISQVSGGLKTISTDMAAVQSATTAAAENKATAKLAHDWAGMPAPIAAAVKQIIAFKQEFTSLSKSSGIQSSVLGDLTQGLQIARQLLPEIVPLAQAGARSVSIILTMLGTAFQSQGFRQFIQLMTSMATTATTAIMRLALVLSGTLGQAIEALMGNSVPFIRFLTVLIQALSGPLIAALNIVIGLFLSLMSAVEPLLPGLSQIATVLIQDIGGSFSAFIPILVQVISLLGGSLLKILTDLEPVIANALTPNGPFMLALRELPVILAAIMPLINGFVSILANPVVAQAAVWVISLVVAFRGLMGVASLMGTAFTWLVGLPELIMGSALAMNVATVAARVWAAAQWLLDAALDANPIGLIIIAIAALIAIVVLLVMHWKTVWHDILVVVDGAVKFIEAHWKLLAVILATVLLGPVAGLVVFLATHFGEVKRIIGDVISWIAGHWKEIVAWLVDPVGMAVFEIRTHTHEIAQAFDQMRHDIAAVLAGARHDVASAFDDVRHSIAAFIGWLPHAIASAWDAARHDQAAALDAARHDVASAWDAIRHATAAGIDNVLSFFSKLPGQVTSFLASLPGKMLSIGENVIKGLINGILAAAAQIPSIMAGLASDVASYFTNPLKLFSPSRLFFDHGWNIVQGAINGVKANAPALMATMRGLGTGVGAAGTGSSLAAGAIAPAGGSTSVHVTVPTTVQGATSSAYSSPEFTQYMQAQVQEAVLRYGQLNPGNGLTPMWGH